MARKLARLGALWVNHLKLVWLVHTEILEYESLSCRAVTLWVAALFYGWMGIKKESVDCKNFRTRPWKNDENRKSAWRIEVLTKDKIDADVPSKVISKGTKKKERQTLCPVTAIAAINWLSPAPVRPWTSLRWKPLTTCVYPHHLKDYRKNVIKIYLNRRIEPQKGMRRVFEAWCIPFLCRYMHEAK